MYEDLEEICKDIIRGCISTTGYIEGGHLRDTMDLQLPNLYNLEFFPCEFQEDYLIVKFKDWKVHDLTFNIPEIIENYFKGNK
jgi:hypothetical protein